MSIKGLSENISVNQDQKHLSLLFISLVFWSEILTVARYSPFVSYVFVYPGTLTSITNFASSVSRNMDRLSMDSDHLQRQEEAHRQRPDGLSDGLVQGLTGFGISLLGRCRLYM